MADPVAAPRKIKLVRIAHAIYRHKDLAPSEAFLRDFGFNECSRHTVSSSPDNVERIYYRGYGTEPFVVCIEKADENSFGGVAFVVESEDDLQYASETLPGATGVYDLAETKGAPGGGKCVTFSDPTDGFPFHLVYGQTAVDAHEPHFPELKINYVSEIAAYNPIPGWSRLCSKPGAAKTKKKLI